jgi:uncharacterized membrane protein SpoIIM required for sporulation
MLLLSMISTTVCIAAAWSIFPQFAGIIAPLLITVAMSPVIYRIFLYEEELEREEAEHRIQKGFWDRHGETILLFTLFFIGNFIIVFLAAIGMPKDFVNAAFSQQLADIAAIGATVSGAVTAAAISSGVLKMIIFNNLRVMLIAFGLSFLIGTGALFILSWNASILAIYLGNFVRAGLYHDFLLQTAGILPHAPVEILAYFLAGIAGGILSAGAIREKMRSPEFKLIFRDSLLLLGLSIVAVLAGAMLEVYL